MIPVYVGTCAKFDKVAPVMAYCLVKHTDSDVTMTLMDPDDIGMDYTGCTGFTNTRFAVPELAGYDGFAIYLDVDMFVLGDIAELYEYREPGKWVVLEDGSNEVSVIDCSAFRDLPAISWLGSLKKHQLQARVADRVVKKIPLAWNVEDRVVPGMKLLHFTDLKQQPWFHDHSNPEAVAIWEQLQSEVA